MSKILILCSLFIFSSYSTLSEAREVRDEESVSSDLVEKTIFQSVGSFQVDKFIDTSSTFGVNLMGLTAVKLYAIKNHVEIYEVRLNMADGSVLFLDDMKGRLEENRDLIYYFAGPIGLHVESITVRATTRNIMGGRPILNVAVGIL